MFRPPPRGGSDATLKDCLGLEVTKDANSHQKLHLAGVLSPDWLIGVRVYMY